MRKNLHQLLADFESAGSELEQAVESRIAGSFRKVWKQDEFEFAALKKYEEIAASIADTVSYCVVLAKSLRANRVALAQRNDHLSTDYMERERRNLERAAELRALTQRPEPEPIAETGDQPAELATEA